jgi:glycosyltransferase involved in cell wall biosynthesis
MRALIVDPSAYSPPYDEALCAALVRAGVDVELVTSRFAHGTRPAPEGYGRRELFYRRAHGAGGWGGGVRARQLGKLATHAGGMRGLRHLPADIVHLQWTPIPWLDVALLPARPRVLTVHNAAPRSDRFGRARAVDAVIERMDALVVHSEHGRARLLERDVGAGRIHVIPHGAFIPEPGPPAPLPPELSDDGRPVVLMFGLLRPYKGLSTLLAAWRGIEGAQLWVVGRPMMALPPIPSGVSLVPRYVTAGESSALRRRADVIVLPYERDERIDGSGVLAGALGAGRAAVVSAVGGLTEIAAAGAALAVEPGDPDALRDALNGLVADPDARARLAAAAAAAAAGPYSWDAAAQATVRLYEALRARPGAARTSR